MIRILFFLFFFLFLVHVACFSQSVTITGKAYDREAPLLPLTKLMIINKRTNQGFFAEADGQFRVVANKTDTLFFSALGFMLKQVSMVDSVYKPNYKLSVPLKKLEFTLKEVSVFANRSLNDIQKDINKLGIKSTYTTVGAADALSSPLTYLYERFSKFERSKRKVAEWENEELKRDVLKELFRIYIKNEIIDLPDEEFDTFIKYLNLSDEFIRSASQFELVMAIKGKYESFKFRWK